MIKLLTQDVLNEVKELAQNRRLSFINIVKDGEGFYDECFHVEYRTTEDGVMNESQRAFELVAILEELNFELTPGEKLFSKYFLYYSTDIDNIVYNTLNTRVEKTWISDEAKKKNIFMDICQGLTELTAMGAKDTIVLKQGRKKITMDVTEVTNQIIEKLYKEGIK